MYEHICVVRVGIVSWYMHCIANSKPFRILRSPSSLLSPNSTSLLWAAVQFRGENGSSSESCSDGTFVGSVCMCVFRSSDQCVCVKIVLYVQCWDVRSGVVSILSFQRDFQLQDFWEMDQIIFFNFLLPFQEVMFVQIVELDRSRSCRRQFESNGAVWNYSRTFNPVGYIIYIPKIEMHLNSSIE